MIERISTGEKFSTRKEAKQKMGGKWAFERLVRIGDVRFIKDGNIVARDDIHDNRQENSIMS